MGCVCQTYIFLFFICQGFFVPSTLHDSKIVDCIAKSCQQWGSSFGEYNCMKLADIIPHHCICAAVIDLQAEQW